MYFTAIDFETANERADSVCSLGMVRVENGVITDKKYRLIRPPDMRFSRHNIAVHGISPDDVRKEFEFYRYWKSIREFLEPYPVVAHNAGFDFGVLEAILRRYDLEFPNISYTCSLRTARRAWKGLPSYKLNELAKRFGHKFVHHHALEDAEAAAKIMIHACTELETETLETLNQKLKIEFGYMSKMSHVKVKSK